MKLQITQDLCARVPLLGMGDKQVGYSYQLLQRGRKLSLGMKLLRTHTQLPMASDPTFIGQQHELRPGELDE